MSFLEEVSTHLQKFQAEIHDNKILLNHNENAHQNYYHSKLKTVYKDCFLEYEGLNMPHNRVDIYIKNQDNDKVFIEVKYNLNSRNELHRLIGQLAQMNDQRRRFKNGGIIIMLSGNNTYIRNFEHLVNQIYNFQSNIIILSDTFKHIKIRNKFNAEFVKSWLDNNIVSTEDVDNCIFSKDLIRKFNLENNTRTNTRIFIKYMNELDYNFKREKNKIFVTNIKWVSDIEENDIEENDIEDKDIEDKDIDENKYKEETPFSIASYLYNKLNIFG